MRGLADSGQANIAQVQSQTAYGETISGLYGQKQAVEQQAVQQRQIIEQSVAAATEQANIQRGQQQLQSDTQLYEQVTAIEENKRSQVAMLMQMALEGQTSAQDIQALAKIYEISDEDLTAVVNAARYFDPTGTISYKDKWDWSNIIETTAAGAVAGALGAGAAGAVGGTAVGGPLGTAVVGGIGFLGGGLIGGIAGLITAITLEATGAAGSGFMGMDTSRRKITASNGQVLEGTQTEIIQQIRNQYQGFPGSDQIAPVFDGTKIEFVYNGARYNTYNEAAAAYRSSQ